jgi:hypothetical protein
VAEIEIKGVAIRTFFQVVHDRKGDAEIEAELRRALPERESDALHSPVLASSWYPISIYRELHRAAQTLLKSGSELSRQIGHDGVARDFRGVYRVLAGVLQPHWLISWAPRMYNRYFRGGRLVVSEARAGFASGQWSGCIGFDKNIWLDMIGSCEASLEACGAQHVRHRLVEGGGDDDKDAVIEFRWV